ncbi:MAG: hypothetical protein H8E17_09830 [Deltaproteobacteria bacterium]|nr:hypothetical protein [Deltaproteobacteria bacterium]
MNILFSTQSAGLKVLYDLFKEINKTISFEKAAFYASQSMYYGHFLKEHPDFESEHTVVKEWEIVAEAKKQELDTDVISEYERAIGNPTLWDAIVCDRRLYLGRQCKVKQDYTPSFNHEEMLKVLQRAMVRFDRLLADIKPDIVLSLDPVTFGDYLLYFFCKSRKIPMLFLRTTKINKYVEFNDGIFGCSSHIYKMFQEYEASGKSDEWTEQAERYLKEARQSDIRYEGMILVPSKRKKKNARKHLLDKFVRAIKVEWEYLRHYRSDHAIPGVLLPAIYRKFVSPIKAKYHAFKYSKYYVSQKQLDAMHYAFYPLQSEPEISSLIWGKPYMNHIENVRMIARSLPVGMKLVVKEHPRALGYRSAGYYSKLLQVPNVMLANPNMEVRPIIKSSKMVISIATFVSFEAMIYQVPTVMLGGPRPFSILPDSMVRYVHSANDLAKEMADLMAHYEYKEKPLVHYIAATMRGSVAIDYFTALLKKEQRHGDTGESSFGNEIKKLAAYTTDRILSIFNENKELINRDEEKYGCAK